MRHPIVKLITFGGGSKEYENAAKRLIEQSKEFKSIDERRAYSKADLPKNYYDIFNEISSISQGFGLYSWKPYLINDELSKLELNDILIYIDAGCELNKYGVRRFDDYLSYTSKNDVLLFEQQHLNRVWTKNHNKLLLSEHFFRNTLVAGIIFLKNTERARKLVKTWLDLCAYENGALLRDPKESELQLEGFKKHRHDQSCLSVCAYMHNMATIPDETNIPDWNRARNYPILAIRNKSGTSRLGKNIRNKFLNNVISYLKCSLFKSNQ